MIVFCSFCNAQNKTELPTGDTKSETKDVITYHGPNNISRTIMEDRHGNIWFSSWEGIFRYDGKSVTNITNKVSSARFFSVLEDRKGNLWFGSIGSGVYYYDGKSFQNFTTKDGLVNNEIGCIYEDKTGNIWFGVNGGASCYAGKSFRNYMMNGDFMTEDRTGKTFPDFTRPPNEVNSIIEDKTGKFCFGTRGNTLVYDGKTFTVFTNKDGKAFNNVWSIIEDKKGNIWLGDNDGLWRYDGSTFTKVTERGASAIIEDKKGNIWTTGSVNPPGGRVWALSRYDQKSLYNKKPTLTEIMSINGTGALCGILEANDGSIWFGSLGPMSGVYRYDGKTITDFESKEEQK